MTATIKRNPRNKGMRRIQISRAFMDTEMDDKDLVSMTQRDHRLVRGVLGAVEEVVNQAKFGSKPVNVENLIRKYKAFNAPEKRK